MTLTYLPLLKVQLDLYALACLFGDTAAKALGYPPRGLSDRAGFALALHQARERQPASQ